VERGFRKRIQVGRSIISATSISQVRRTPLPVGSTVAIGTPFEAPISRL
jgi:hypothetical protein